MPGHFQDFYIHWTIHPTAVRRTEIGRKRSATSRLQGDPLLAQRFLLNASESTTHPNATYLLGYGTCGLHYGQEHRSTHRPDTFEQTIPPTTEIWLAIERRTIHSHSLDGGYGLNSYATQETHPTTFIIPTLPESATKSGHYLGFRSKRFGHKHENPDIRRETDTWVSRMRNILLRFVFRPGLPLLSLRQRLLYLSHSKDPAGMSRQFCLHVNSGDLFCRFAIDCHSRLCLYSTRDIH